MGKHTKTVVLAFSLACAPLIMAQGASTPPSPVQPGEVLGPQLIAWSQLQKPQPVPQPMSQSEETTRPTEQESGYLDPKLQIPSSQILRGIIVREGAGYLLKTSDPIAYRLDDQPGVEKYEGTHAKVVGTINPDSKSFHIISIDLIP